MIFIFSIKISRQNIDCIKRNSSNVRRAVNTAFGNVQHKHFLIYKLVK